MSGFIELLGMFVDQLCSLEWVILPAGPPARFCSAHYWPGEAPCPGASPTKPGGGSCCSWSRGVSSTSASVSCCSDLWLPRFKVEARRCWAFTYSKAASSTLSPSPVLWSAVTLQSSSCRVAGWLFWPLAVCLGGCRVRGSILTGGGWEPRLLV